MTRMWLYCTALLVGALALALPSGAIAKKPASSATPVFKLRLKPSQEAPPIKGLKASARGTVTFDLERSGTGAITSGEVIFSFNYSFPGAVTITGLHVHRIHSGVIRRKNLPVRIINTCVAISGAHEVDSREIRCHGQSARWVNMVNRPVDRVLLAGLDIENVADESVVNPIIPEDLVKRSGPPLQHTSLLPAPRPGTPQRYPRVVVFQVNHADMNRVIRPR